MAFSILRVANEYGVYDRSVIGPYPFLENLFLVEPYRETTIRFAPLNYCTSQ